MIKNAWDIHGNSLKVCKVIKFVKYHKAIELNILNLYKLSTLKTLNYSWNFLTITEALCPPKPNVLLRAARTTLFCALLKVKLSLLSSSGSSVKWLMVGGIRSFFTAIMQAIASMAPAAPKR